MFNVVAVDPSPASIFFLSHEVNRIQQKQYVMLLKDQKTQAPIQQKML